MTSASPAPDSPFLAREIRVVHHGHPVTVRHRPSDYPWRRLGSQLADALVERAASSGLAKDTLNVYVKVIRDFCQFLGENSDLPPLGLEATGCGISDGIHAWSNHLRQSHSRRSNGPHRYVGALCILIIGHAECGHQVGATTLTRARAGSLLPRGFDGDSALAEFSNRERLMIRDSARQQVRALEQRLLVGASLLSNAHNPLQDRFPDVQQMLISMRDGNSADLEGVDLDSIEWPAETASLGYRDHKSSQRTARRRLASLLGPTGKDLQGFRALLMQASGWAPEEVHDLLISETSSISNGQIYTRKKARARYVKEAVVPNGKSGEWDFNALTRRLLAATAAIRPLADAPARDWYFISVSGHLLRPTVRVADFHTQGVNFSTWVAERQLDLTLPHDIRRIRKTVRTIETLKATTLEEAAGDEHTARTYRRHYLPSATTKVLAHHVLRTASDEMLNGVRSTGPTVIGIPADQIHDSTTLPAVVLNVASKELLASELDRSLLPVTCQDEFNSPFGDAGGLCPTMVSHCMVCPNAYIFEDHIPRLAAYEKMLDEFSSELSPPEFQKRYAVAADNVAKAMDAMDPEIVRTARSVAKTSTLNLPIGMRVRLS